MIDRRSFFKRLLTGAGVFTILPPAETYERIWRAERKVITCAEFACEMLDQVPVFDRMFLESFVPLETWIGHVECAPPPWLPREACKSKQSILELQRGLQRRPHPGQPGLPAP